MALLRISFWCWLVLCGTLSALADDLSVYGLVCEQLENPVGIDRRVPRFSWKLHSQKRGCLQKSYRILVASSRELLAKDEGDVWDSGKVRSGQSLLVAYAGDSLKPACTYYWKVRVSDRAGHRSAWSETQYFTTGLFGESDWQGTDWIAFQADGEKIVPSLPAPEDRRVLDGRPVGRYALPLLRKEFRLERGDVVQALAYVSGMGHFDFYLNGEKVGRHFLDPGWTKYDKEALYAAFDVTERLRRGDNAMGVMLGNGFYNIPNERYYKLTGSFGAPKLRLKLWVRYADGSVQQVGTDGTWKASPGPITFSSIFAGEDYDATRAKIGWSDCGFDDKEWQPALAVSQSMGLKAQLGTHLAVRNVLPVVTRYKNSKGMWIYDLGQNFSGIVRLRVKGERGREVLLRPGELLNSDSTVNQSASGEPYYFKYTLGGQGQAETWQPQFTYYGFRYVQVEGAVPEGADNPDGMPEIVSLEGLHTCNGAAEAGTFSCSSPMFNKIYNLIDWAMRSNMASVLTDCPHREKLGWQEEAHLMQYALQYRYDLSSLYPKVLSDLRASQLESGAVPSIAPEFVRFAGGFEDSPEWGSSLVICPWYVYKWYGDRSLLEECYPQMKRYVEYLGTRAEGHIVAYGLGDWYDLGPNAPGYAQLTSNGVTATAMYYYDVTVLRQAASLLGREDDARRFALLADSIKVAYNRRFYHPAEGCYDRNSQTANAISLFMGLVDDGERARVTESLVGDIRSRGNALTAGDIGYRYVLRALEAAGRADVIYDMNSRYDVPGYGWQLAHGATALTESWQAYGFVSNNHFMLGHLMEWFFSGLGGIRQTESSVAFEHILIDPQLVGDITSARTAYESAYGRIVCEWELKDGCYTLHVVVPANTVAEVMLPTDETDKVTEYGRPLEEGGAMSVEHASGRLRVTVGSGDYKFKVTGISFRR